MLEICIVNETKRKWEQRRLQSWVRSGKLHDRRVFLAREKLVRTIDVRMYRASFSCGTASKNLIGEIIIQSIFNDCVVVKAEFPIKVLITVQHLTTLKLHFRKSVVRKRCSSHCGNLCCVWSLPIDSPQVICSLLDICLRTFASEFYGINNR